jgi:hypothetical protein
MNARKAAKLAIGAAGALQGAGAGEESGGAGPADGYAEPSRPRHRGLLIGLAVVVVLVLALLAFLVLWDFEGAPSDDGGPAPEPVPVEAGGDPGVSEPSSSGA